MTGLSILVGASPVWGLLTVCGLVALIRGRAER